MDFDSSTKFISSLAKFLQSLCNGYVEFNSGVEVIGHIYINVDTGKKIDYILNEKVCKTDENSVTFISNSFHAQPAEKPKPPSKNAGSTEGDKLPEVGTSGDEEEIIIMEEPESKNVGTVPSRDNLQRLRASPHSKLNRSSKRSYNQSFPSGHVKHSTKQSRSDLSSGPNGVQQDTDSLHSESSSSNFLPSQLTSDSTLMAASESDMTHLSKVFPQTFNDSPDNQGAAGERDIKPQLDSDMNIVQVKQEFQLEQGGEDDQESFDDSQDHGSGVFPGMQYNQYYGDSGRGQRSDFGSGGIASDFFQGGSGTAGDAVGGDSSALHVRATRGKRRSQFLQESISDSVPSRPSFNSHIRMINASTSSANSPSATHQYAFQPNTGSKERRKMNFECEICGQRLPSRREYVGHMNGRHLGQKPFACEFCGRQFAYITSLPMHKKTCPVIHSANMTYRGRSVAVGSSPKPLPINGQQSMSASPPSYLLSSASVDGSGDRNFNHSQLSASELQDQKKAHNEESTDN